MTEASSGEAVLQLVNEKSFHLIFCDQYMPACPGRTLLGTEVVRKLRARGTKSMICGLSKNQVGEEFLEAGADFFLLKPYPCKKDEFREMLLGLCEVPSFESPKATLKVVQSMEVSTVEPNDDSLMFANPLKNLETGFRGVRTKVEPPQKKIQGENPGSGGFAPEGRKGFAESLLSANSESRARAATQRPDHFAIGVNHPIKEPEQDFLKLVASLKQSRNSDSQSSAEEKEVAAVKENVVPQIEPYEGTDIPESKEVLLVDDEKILRKLFIRSVATVAPSWHITEACNAANAVELAREKKFDLIIIDHYMPNLENPLLGTEAVEQMRRLGVESLICGLSANQMKDEFLRAGVSFEKASVELFPCLD